MASCSGADGMGEKRSLDGDGWVNAASECFWVFVACFFLCLDG